jgi:hypothetical protein
MTDDVHLQQCMPDLRGIGIVGGVRWRLMTQDVASISGGHVKLTVEMDRPVRVLEVG